MRNTVTSTNLHITDDTAVGKTIKSMLFPKSCTTFICGFVISLTENLEHCTKVSLADKT